MEERNNQKKKCELCYLSLVLPIPDLFFMYVSVGGALPLFSLAGIICGGIGLSQTIKNKNLKGKWVGIIGFSLSAVVIIISLISTIQYWR